MNYHSYAKSADTPNRKSRKGARREVFVYNKTAKGKQLKARRLERKSLESDQG